MRKPLDLGERTWLYRSESPTDGKIFAFGSDEYEDAVASGLWFTHYLPIFREPLQTTRPAPIVQEVVEQPEAIKRGRGRPSKINDAFSSKE